MTTKTNNVVSFVLSKDLHCNVQVRIHCLKGIPTSLLYETIVGNNIDQHNLDCTDILLEEKFKKLVSHSDIICELYIESGHGNVISVPVKVGLLGEIDTENDRNSKENDHCKYTDGKYVKFKPQNLGSKVQLSDSSQLYSGTEISDFQQDNENINWIQLPLEYSKLPIDSSIVFSFWCYDVRNDEKRFLCGGKSKLFDDSAKLVGPHALINIKSRSNPIDTFDRGANDDACFDDLKSRQKKPKWLFEMSKDRCHFLENTKHMKGNHPIQLQIEFQQFDFPIVYSDIKYVPLMLHSVDQTNSVLKYDQSFNEITYTNLDMDTLVNNSYFANRLPFDPDYIRDEEMEDPIEQKFRKLERMQQISPLDRDLKPTLKLKEELNKIMKKPFFEKLTAKERNMVWRYRWYVLNMLIVGNPGMNNAMINFIKCVDWNNQSEVREVESILGTLEENLKSKVEISTTTSKLDIFIMKLQIIDCLELLSSNYRNKIVRQMAVTRLRTATDADLEMFMVQLVQCIKNEALAIVFDPLSVEEGSTNLDYPTVEEEEDADMKVPSSAGTRSNLTTNSSEYQFVDNHDHDNITDSLLKEFIDTVLFKRKSTPSSTAEIPSLYIKFLLSRVISNPILTNYFYWNLKVELEGEIFRNKQVSNSLNLDVINSENLNTDLSNHIHQVTMKSFLLALYNSPHGKTKLFELRRQVELVSKLHSFCYKIKVVYRRETTPRKVEILKSLLSEKHKRTIFGSKHGSRNHLMEETKSESMIEFPTIALPLDPSVHINGTFYEESTVFKSSLNPLKITFRTVEGGKYPIMYKIGDDLKQDQFVTQIISLMEKVLASENMDLRLKPYKILATGLVEGFIQFIPNNSLSHILANYNNSILQYLQTFNPDPTAHLGVVPQVMDTYIRSCAGYCVVTYILGVGDRHLENLLLSQDGHFFHADFGYILGQDPKPFPPLMKLPIQIIEGMGGLDDVNYKTFCQYCFITYITLRKNAYLILNLVQLMINTSIPALRTSSENNETEKMELLWKVEEKFMLEMNDEEAVLHFQNLIDNSVNAVLPVVIDRLHNLAQYWRS
ncbi:hypothetical protein CANINC_002431 [Pichia inconspicua]|uniref:Phosphatidylinositol 3-kinase VPS34 n=1 Tax=Pichia inconspicua TaxID=52247 RepID=A0A4T0X2I9_9ASCO|nr:hypothetical protein CANINC_002431 [[Candida] inconspicua]